MGANRVERPRRVVLILPGTSKRGLSPPYELQGLGTQKDRQMWFHVQTWLPLLSVALTAAICLAAFIMGRSVKPHQP
jgi:hypothetical protein